MNILIHFALEHRNSTFKYMLLQKQNILLDAYL